MDYESKYNEAIKRAKQHCADYVVETIFPELKESEGEKIRKEIINYLRGRKSNETYGEIVIKYIRWIEWLEKQGEQQDVSIQINPSEYINNMGGNGCYLKNTTQKSTDKTEPKFKVGDEIKTANEESLTITKIDEKGYWSKDLFICDFEEECLWDLVEQKSAWGKQDDRMLDKCIEAACSHYYQGISSVRDWLRGIKDRLLSQPKQELSEEDSIHFDRILKELKEQKQRPINYPYLKDIDSDIDWLKSLKDRYTWKPSDEQMEGLLWVLENCAEREGASKMLSLANSIYDNLKKIKG